MKLIREALIIIAICFLGEVIHRLFSMPIPGNVIGMVMLLIALCTGVVKLEMIENISDFLLKHLAFFFIPAGVGLIACLDMMKSNWLAIMAVLFISTMVIMIVTGLTVQLLKGGKQNERVS